MKNRITFLFLVFLLNKVVFPQENTEFYLNSPEKIPSDSDWKYFMNLKQSERQAIFKSTQKAEKNLNKWSWPWRQGWLQVCDEDPASWCRELVFWGLDDNAAIVRAKAARSLGSFYADTKNQAIIEVLEEAYLDKRNYRNGKPLFVCNDIIFAIMKIGGKATKDRVFKLAQNHQATKEYWQKLYR